MAGLREAKWTTAELIEHGFEGQQRQPAVAFNPGTSVLVPHQSPSYNRRLAQHCDALGL